MALVSVIMPTYNDRNWIESSIESVLRQKKVEIQLIIVDDGSTDGTAELLDKINNPLVTVIHKKNEGQLNAIYSSLKYIKGDYVTILHSDDEFLDEYSLLRNVEIINKFKADGLNADLVKINENGTKTGIIKTANIFQKDPYKITFKFLINLGSNIVSDVFFVKRKFFFRNVVKNYVVWNIPYWFVLKNGKIQLGNIYHSNIPWYKYRVSSENYIHSDIGKFVCLNGVIRSILTLLRYTQPRMNSFLFLFCKILRRLGIDDICSAFISYKFSTGTYKGNIEEMCSLKNVAFFYLIRLISSYKFTETFSNNFYKSLISFYRDERCQNVPVINLSIDKNVPLFFGKDVRLFYNHSRRNGTPEPYYSLIKQASLGFFKVNLKTCNEGTIRKLKIIYNFLNIFPPTLCEGRYLNI